jgi:copper chaperone NosL
VRRPEWLVAALVAAGVVVVVVVWGSARPPQGPVEPHWDHDRCARCGMLISQPGFAAQVQRADGRVLQYDDPGCLLADDGPARGLLDEAHAVYFHDASAPRWIPLAEVGFMAAERTPMDFGLAAVERADHPDAWTLEEALARVRAHVQMEEAP